ncbi:DUF6197 family protein [Agrobacterium salinitolerans]
MNTVQILKEARALIADGGKWTQGAFARNSLGEKVDPSEEGAVCFCAIGALAKAAGANPESELPAENLLVTEMLELDARECIPEFNDSHTHADVLALFDRAIARAESEAA